MKFFLCVIALWTWFSGNSQNKETYLVEYRYEQKAEISTDSLHAKKVDVSVIYNDQKKIGKAESLVGDLLPGTMNFQTIFFILANPDSSKMYFGKAGEAEGGIILSVNTPDTIFYSGKFWKRITDNEVEVIQPVSISVVETNERKIILGYECTKFVSRSDDKDMIIFWATKRLPNTLLPFTGLESFKYGILEITHMGDNWHTLATRVRKM